MSARRSRFACDGRAARRTPRPASRRRGAERVALTRPRPSRDGRPAQKEKRLRRNLRRCWALAAVDLRTVCVRDDRRATQAGKPKCAPKAVFVAPYTAEVLDALGVDKGLSQELTRIQETNRFLAARVTAQRADRQESHYKKADGERRIAQPARQLGESRNSHSLAENRRRPGPARA